MGSCVREAFGSTAKVGESARRSRSAAATESGTGSSASAVGATMIVRGAAVLEGTGSSPSNEDKSRGAWRLGGMATPAAACS
eukprot:13474262-Alexandrium_andersonii.AAC.1